MDDYEFFTVGTGDLDFAGYNSDADPTVVAPNVMVGGSKNVYKKNKGTIAVRPGLKRYLEADDSDNGTKSSFEWQTSFGEIRTIRVLEDGQWQVLFNDVWNTLGTFDLTRFVFSPWWSDSLGQELLTMVNGSSNIYSWSGGIIEETGASNSAGVVAIGSAASAGATLGAPALVASVVTETENIDAGNNVLQSTSARAAFVLDVNPDVNDTISLAVAQANPFTSGTVNIRFTNDVSGAASSTALVLLGATKEATATNLLGFFTDPANNTATHRGITAGDTLDALLNLTYAAANSLKTGDGENWSEKGFTDGYPALGSAITIDGTEYSYTLIAERYLVNITGAPEGETGFQIIETNDGPAEDFTADFIVTITNQLVVASYSSSIIYFSSDLDFTDFVNGGDLIAGDPDQLVLDELPKGMIVVNEAVYIAAGTGSWYICEPNTPLPVAQTIGTDDRLVIIKVTKKVGAAQTAALAHEFIGSIADTLIYLGQDHQLRMFGTFKDILGTKFPSISVDIKQELIDTDFTGGQLRAVGDNIYLIAPVPGKVFVYQQRDDVDGESNIVSARIWQPPMDWNISRIAVIDDVEYGYSNESPETYQLWDTNQWHDDTPSGIAPYECVLRFGYWNFKDRTKLGALDKLYFEGYMEQNASLTSILRSDYLGSTAIEDVVISAEGDVPTLFTESGNLIGQKLIGQELIGGATGLTGLPKFRAIAQFQKKQCFEYQIELSSFVIDSRWEIICVGSNGSQVINKTPFLLKG